MKQKKTAAALRLCALLLVITALAGWFLTQKSGYHLDEGLSLSLANSEGDWDYRTLFYELGGLRQFCLDHVFTGGFFSSIRNVFTIGLDYLRNGQDSPWYAIYSENYAPALGEMAWVNGAEHFVRHATVTDGNLFSRLLTVYANQASDVHPPLYYLLLNLICSFFPGTYSNWYPFAVNIVFLLLACVMLYRIARRFGEETLALVSVALYGLSCGFVSTAVLFRMYAVLTFFCCWALSCHLRLQEEGWRASRGTAWQLVLVNVFGFYTQYYFIIYSAFLALVSLICMLARRRGKDALRYLGLMLLAACASLVIWPFSVYHIFGGYRGAEAFANANFAQFAEHLEEYGAILSGALLGGCFCGASRRKEESRRGTQTGRSRRACPLAARALPCGRVFSYRDADRALSGRSLRNVSVSVACADARLRDCVCDPSALPQQGSAGLPAGRGGAGAFSLRDVSRRAELPLSRSYAHHRMHGRVRRRPCRSDCIRFKPESSVY